MGTEDDDLRLLTGSLAIDSGDKSAPGLDGVTTDLDGDQRIVNEIIDMGALEFPGSS